MSDTESEEEHAARIAKLREKQREDRTLALERKIKKMERKENSNKELELAIGFSCFVAFCFLLRMLGCV